MQENTSKMKIKQSKEGKVAVVILNYTTGKVIVLWAPSDEEDIEDWLSENTDIVLSQVYYMVTETLNIKIK